MWNYRILATETKGEVYFRIHEVFYKNRKPHGYVTQPSIVGGESIIEVHTVLTRMEEAANKPVLWAGERFPEEYKPE